MKRQCGDGGAENGKKGNINKRKEEDVMGQINEIGRITDYRRKAFGSGRENF